MNYDEWTTDELIEECYKLGILKGEDRNVRTGTRQ